MEKQALGATSMELEEGNPWASPNFPKELLSLSTSQRSWGSH